MRIDVGNLNLFGVDLNKALRWWGRGLRESFPVGFETLFLRPSPKIKAIVEGDWLYFQRIDHLHAREAVRIALEDLSLTQDGGLRGDLLGAGPLKMDLVQLELVLPDARVLRKHLPLPQEVRDEVREVVGYQLGRLTPFPAEKLYFDARITERPGAEGMLDVELVAVPRAYADPFIEQVERLSGFRVSRLGVAGERPYNLFGSPRVSSRWWRRLSLNSWLLALSLLALLACAAVPLLKERQLVIERKQQIAALQGEVTGLMATNEMLEKDLASLNHILDQRSKLPQTSAIIAEMSKVVPDNIYMADLRIQGDTVTMTGYGSDVVNLIDLINASELFDGARFTSPVSRNARTGLDQFTVSARLTATGAGE
ncbi:PilN domain-containing protein [Pseudomonas sp. RIT-PI-AD]|uniref:PilN domain-containing protein n=1 Tax=Pseudomonas sp. RIT-PI-AD TaxID=3035294 RepID=UPI0021D8BBF0|nr:PilN domain-containing protein [Pseudomonas sp. RIT-PI-AD]